MVLSTTALLRQNPRPTLHEIQKALEGNLCRCTGYNKIVDAVQRAAAATAGHG
ncbi:MAG: 2Fe-2S iron-sulfur cluster-binding protein [Deferrisomatales bacterium]